MPTLDNARRIDEVLGTNVAQMIGEVSRSHRFDVYVSAPLRGVAAHEFEGHRNDVGTLVNAIRGCGLTVYWGGEDRSPSSLNAPDLDAERNLAGLHRSSAIAYLQFARTVSSSSSLLELGISPTPATSWLRSPTTPKRTARTS